MTAGAAARRAGSAITRTLALALSAASGLALAAHLAVSSGGVPLGVLTPAVAAEVSARTGAAVSLDAARLVRAGAGEGGPVALVLRGASLADAGRAASLPDGRVALRTGDLLRGQVAPAHVTVRGARVEVVRTKTGLSLSGRNGALDLARLAEAADARGLGGLTIEDAGFAYRSEVPGASFEASGAAIEVWPDTGGYAATALLPLGDGVIEADAVIGEAPVATLRLRGVPGGLLGRLVPEAPVRADGALDGEVVLTRLETGGTAAFDLTLGEGRVRLGAREGALNAARATGSFDLAARRLTLDEMTFAMGHSAGAVSGTVDLSGPPAFDIQAAPLTLDLDAYEAPLALRRAALRGGFADGVLTFGEAAITHANGAALSGDLALTFGAASPGIAGTIRADASITPRQLAALWPVRVAPATRGWVRDNVEGGEIGGLTILAALPPGQLGSGTPMTSGMLDARMRLQGAALTYLRGMPPSVGADAAVHLTGTAFEARATGGTVGGAQLTAATFRQPKLGPQRTPVEIEASLTGSAQDLLAIADSPPLGYLAAAKLSPDDFAGQGRFAFTLRRPLGENIPPDQVEFAGEGAFDALGLTGLPADIELSGGRGTVRIGEGALSVTGAADVLGVPATGTLTRSFGADGAPPQMTLTARAALTPRDADALGIPLRRFARGQAPAMLTMTGQDRFETAQLEVDLTDTALAVPVIGLDKSAGSEGAFAIRFVLPEEGGPLTADSLRLATKDVLIEGSARWDEAGGLAMIDLPRVFSDGTLDLGATVRRGEDGLALDVAGRHADVNPLVDALLGEGAPEAGDAPDAGGAAREGGVPIRFSAELDRVTARGGQVLTGFTASGAHDGESLTELSLAAGIAVDDGLDAGRVTFEVVPDAGGVGREVRLATDRSGALLTALFGIDSVTGGPARLDATAIAGGPLTGRFEADALVLRDAPLVAKLLSVGSLDGLAGVLGGEGLAFDRLSGALTLEDGTLTLADARMTGSALGLSVNGDVDLNARRLDISGAVAPAYGVNSLLGAVPLLGELFVSREGEGVVAFSYGVTGPIGEPTVSVNTLSALAPGVLRRMFEPVRPERRTPEDLLDAATEAAALREDRETARDAEQLAAEEEALNEARDGAETTGSLAR